MSKPTVNIDLERGPWADDGSEGLRFYPAGTWGPEGAARLFDGSPRSWRRL